ncbi:MAG: hypothetical protein ACMXYF_01845 [Candidatus Woesearchaeota archaeon]
MSSYLDFETSHTKRRRKRIHRIKVAVFLILFVSAIVVFSVTFYQILKPEPISDTRIMNLAQTDMERAHGECSRFETIEQQNSCYAYIAFEQYSVERCFDISTVYRRDMCILNLVVNDRVQDGCQFIELESVQEACLAHKQS